MSVAGSTSSSSISSNTSAALVSLVAIRMASTAHATAVRSNASVATVPYKSGHTSGPMPDTFASKYRQKPRRHFFSPAVCAGAVGMFDVLESLVGLRSLTCGVAVNEVSPGTCVMPLAASNLARASCAVLIWGDRGGLVATLVACSPWATAVVSACT